MDLEYIETSSKTGENVELTFNTLTGLILNNLKSWQVYKDCSVIYETMENKFVSKRPLTKVSKPTVTASERLL